MRILWNNLIDSAVLSCFSENPNYPLSNVKEMQLSSRFQTVGNDGEYIVMDCTVAVPVSRFAIIGHNLSASATITLQGNSTNTWSAPAFSQTVARKSWAIIHRFTEASYRYWRVVITDTGVSSIRISRLFLGTFLQLPGMKKDQEFNFEVTDEAQISETGQVFPVSGYSFKNQKINFPYLTNEERLQIEEMFEAVRNTKPVLLAVWDDREDIEPPVYCIINQKKLSFKRNEDSESFPWGTGIEIREAK